MVTKSNYGLLKGVIVLAMLFADLLSLYISLHF